MSKIKERRQRTAEAEIDNKATVPDNGGAKTKSYPSKKVLVVLLIIVAIVALFLLIVNAWVDSYASAFAPVDIDNAGATVTLDKLPAEKQEFYNKLDEYLKRSQFKAGYDKAVLNHATASSNIKWEDGIYNFVVFAVDDVTKSYESAGTISIVSINTNTNKVNYSVVHSDTLVYITTIGEGENEQEIVGPLCDAYLWGGEALLARAVQDNYGVKVNGFMKFSYSATSAMIDTFGNITIENVNADTVAKVNEVVSVLKTMEGFEDIKDVTLNGTSISLDGKQVVAYIKARETKDYSPINEIAKSLTGSIVSGGFGNIIKALDTAKSNIKASVTRSDFGTLLQHGITNSMTLDKSIETGSATKAYHVVNVSVCDYTAERTALVNMIYPAKAEK